MKKILKHVVLVILIAVVLFANFGIGASASEPLEEMLIGTWRWDTNSSWIVVFRPDGTGVDGLPGFRTEFTWHVTNDRLFMDGEDTNIRISGDRMTLGRLGSTYTYIWDSDATEAETSIWLIVTILILLFVVLPVGLIILIIVLVRRRRRRRNAFAADQSTMPEPPAPDRQPEQTASRTARFVNCPGCGATVEAKPGATQRCEYCGSVIETP